jgi:hypothetical protein
MIWENKFAMDRFSNLADILSILSAMLAPVLLISACASLTLSTSNRLARGVERTRTLLRRFEEVARSSVVDASAEEESMMLYDELLLSTRRSRLLQRALATTYMAISVFIATSMVLGLVAILNENYSWLPLFLMIMGCTMLFYSSILLILEIRLTHRAINIEMDFVLARTKHHASRAVQEYQQQQQPAMKDAQAV